MKVYIVTYRRSIALVRDYVDDVYRVKTGSLQNGMSRFTRFIRGFV
jgi:hypothetical protein